MKTKYILIELTEPVEVNTTIPFDINAHAINNTVYGSIHGRSFTVEWVHLFDEQTSGPQRMKNSEEWRTYDRNRIHA